MPAKISVEEYMFNLVHPFKQEIEVLRTIIKNSNAKISERIKWNAPSYYYKEDMAAFNLRKTEFIQLIFVFPRGLVNDDGLILQGTWADRREARFYSMDDIRIKENSIIKLVNDWVTLIDNSESGK